MFNAPGVFCVPIQFVTATRRTFRRINTFRNSLLDVPDWPAMSAPTSVVSSARKCVANLLIIRSIVEDLSQAGSICLNTGPAPPSHLPLRAFAGSS
jgi:hypothetical protein